MKVYISGSMTGVPDKNKERFAAAEEYLLAKGHIVLNPAILPEGLTYQEYMSIDLAMLDAADAIYLLRGWDKSPGASFEALCAHNKGLQIIKEYSPTHGRTVIEGWE